MSNFDLIYLSLLYITPSRLWSFSDPFLSPLSYLVYRRHLLLASWVCYLLSHESRRYTRPGQQMATVVFFIERILLKECIIVLCQQVGSHIHS